VGLKRGSLEGGLPRGNVHQTVNAGTKLLADPQLSAVRDGFRNAPNVATMSLACRMALTRQMFELP
jgi:hypothetical protein